MTDGEAEALTMANKNLQKRVDALTAANIQKEQANAALVGQAKGLQADLDAARAAVLAAKRVADTHKGHADAYRVKLDQIITVAAQTDEKIAEHKRAADLAKADALDAEAKRLRG